MIADRLHIEPAILRHPAMSGDLRNLLDDEKPVVLAISEEDLRQLAIEAPADEWRLAVTEHTWGHRNLTVLAPRDGVQNFAYHAEYWPTPERNRGRLSRHDWNAAAPSPNPGLLAYYLSENLTAISIPMMVKEGVRHDFYRRLFVEITDAPSWLKPAQYHNDPGCTIGEERRLVEELRQKLRRT